MVPKMFIKKIIAPLLLVTLITGVLAKIFLKSFRAHAPYPIKDPRLGEALGHYAPKMRLMSGGELGETEEMEEPTEELPRAEAKGDAR